MNSTEFVARLIGLLLLCVGISILFQRAVFMKVVKDLTSDRTPLFMIGLLLFVGGAAIVLTHNVWNARRLPTVVGIVGWVLVFKSLISMFVPNAAVALLIRALRFEQLSAGYGILVLALGTYLTWAGFTS